MRKVGSFGKSIFVAFIASSQLADPSLPSAQAQVKRSTFHELYQDFFQADKLRNSIKAYERDYRLKGQGEKPSPEAKRAWFLKDVDADLRNMVLAIGKNIVKNLQETPKTWGMPKTPEEIGLELDFLVKVAELLDVTGDENSKDFKDLVKEFGLEPEAFRALRRMSIKAVESSKEFSAELSKWQQRISQDNSSQTQGSQPSINNP